MSDGKGPSAGLSGGDRTLLDVDGGTDVSRMLARLAESDRPAASLQNGEPRPDAAAALRVELDALAARVDALGPRPSAVTVEPAAKPAEVDVAELVASRVSVLERDLEALRAELAATRAATEARERNVSLLVDELRMRLIRSERMLPATLEHRPVDASPLAIDGEHAVIARLEDGRPHLDSFAFLSRFRGSRSENRARLRRFAGAFAGRRAVVDLGCGRGEFLEALAEIGVPATGVDVDSDMAAFCADLRLPAVHADLNAYLASLAPQSLDGVFSSDVLEHLSLSQVTELVGRLRGRVAPGGLVVFETLNPYCPWSLGILSLDPTHVRAFAPELLRFLLESNGFEVRSIEYSPLAPGCVGADPLACEAVGDPEVVKYLDYAITATRTALP